MTLLLFHLAACAVLLSIFLICLAMYLPGRKKRRALKTQITCPRTHRVLMDWELLHGHCYLCISMNASYNRALKDEGVKKCEDGIRDQLAKANKHEGNGV